MDKHSKHADILRKWGEKEEKKNQSSSHWILPLLRNSCGSAGLTKNVTKRRHKDARILWHSDAPTDGARKASDRVVLRLQCIAPLIFIQSPNRCAFHFSFQFFDFELTFQSNSTSNIRNPIFMANGKCLKPQAKMCVCGEQFSAVLLCCSFVYLHAIQQSHMHQNIHSEHTHMNQIVHTCTRNAWPLRGCHIWSEHFVSMFFRRFAYARAPWLPLSDVGAGVRDGNSRS